MQLKMDRKIAVITVVSTLALMVDHYEKLTPWNYVDRFVLYLILPVGITLALFRESPAKYGFRIGDWRMGLKLTAAGIIGLTPVIWLLARGSGALRDYYAWQAGPTMALNFFLDLIGWEFLFRGWLLFGYGQRFGPDAIWLQAVPFALVHIGKPKIETLSTIFGGFLFGWIAWRTRSFLYPFLIHFYLLSMITLTASGWGG